MEGAVHLAKQMVQDGKFKSAVRAVTEQLLAAGWPSDDVLEDEPQLAIHALSAIRDAPNAVELFRLRATVRARVNEY